MRKLVISLLVCLAMATPAFAGAPGPVDMQEVIKELRELKAKLADMDQMKKRVAALEAQLSAAKKQAATADKKSDSALSKVAAATRFNVGGAVRFNYRYTSYNDVQKTRGGDGLFDLFRLNVSGEYNDLLVSAEYRFYSYMHVLHHGWIGYNFSDSIQGQLGVTKVPFGLLPYFSHNYWFSLGYYVGLEDDYDLGAKLLFKSGPMDLQLAFFKNADYGSPGDLERYSVDLVTVPDDEDPTNTQLNEEVNQINARFAYTLTHAKGFSTEVGVSGMYGQLYNSGTDENGSRYAVAAHINGNYGPLNIQLLAAKYMFDPKNPDGVSNDTVTMGAFGASFPVASEAMLYVANVAYTVPVKLGPITSLQFYNDFSVLTKEPDGYENSYLNTLGVMFSANPVYIYVDFIMGKNALWVGAPNNALAAGEEDADWNYMFNVNVGYYF